MPGFNNNRESKDGSRNNGDLFGAELGDVGGLGFGTAGKFRKFAGRVPKRECDDANDPIDYKNLPLLFKYLSPQGKMQSRKRTKYCSQCQRELSAAIKRARFIGLVPYVI